MLPNTPPTLRLTRQFPQQLFPVPTPTPPHPPTSVSRRLRSRSREYHLFKSIRLFLCPKDRQRRECFRKRLYPTLPSSARGSHTLSQHHPREHHLPQLRTRSRVFQSQACIRALVLLYHPDRRTSIRLIGYPDLRKAHRVRPLFDGKSLVTFHWNSRFHQFFQTRTREGPDPDTDLHPYQARRDHLRITPDDRHRCKGRELPPYDGPFHHRGDHPRHFKLMVL